MERTPQRPGVSASTTTCFLSDPYTLPSLSFFTGSASKLRCAGSVQGWVRAGEMCSGRTSSLWRRRLAPTSPAPSALSLVPGLPKPHIQNPAPPLSAHTPLTSLAQCSKMALEDTGWVQVLTGSGPSKHDLLVSF